MKRNGAKAVGLGCALFAAELRLLAEDGAPSPKLLPVDIRPGEWSPAGTSSPPTVWLPAVKAQPQVRMTLPPSMPAPPGTVQAGGLPRESAPVITPVSAPVTASIAG